MKTQDQTINDPIKYKLFTIKLNSKTHMLI